MSGLRNGGPAFPQLDLVRLGDREKAKTEGGLTVWDVYYAFALAGYIASPGCVPSPEDAARKARAYADEALANRREP